VLPIVVTEVQIIRTIEPIIPTQIVTITAVIQEVQLLVIITIPADPIIIIVAVDTAVEDHPVADTAAEVEGHRVAVESDDNYVYSLIQNTNLIEQK
jgi:hypothetical protein